MLGAILRAICARGALLVASLLLLAGVGNAAHENGPLWSLRPIVRPTLPTLGAHADPRWGRNQIDGFIQARLSKERLEPSREGDRRTLIRRLSFDLLGLPPTPEEVDAFLNDASPTAYEKLVDRMLASPRYGERWARHWLDVVRF